MGFVGESGTSTYFNNDVVLNIAKRVYGKDKKGCAICIAPVTLANVRTLEGKRATIRDYEEAIKGKSTTYTGKPALAASGKLF